MNKRTNDSTATLTFHSALALLALIAGPACDEENGGDGPGRDQTTGGAAQGGAGEGAATTEDGSGTGVGAGGMAAAGGGGGAGEGAGSEGGAAPTQVCGDGAVTGDETCDDDNNAGWDGCAADCRSSDSLIAYWRFSETDPSGPLTDVMGAHDAQYVAGSTPGTSGLVANQGWEGSLHVYPGSTAHATIGQPVADPTKGSISAWIRGHGVNDPATYAMVYWQGAVGSAGWSGTDDIHLGVRDDDRFSFRARGCQVDSNIYTLSGTDWYHVVGTYETVDDVVTCWLYVYRDAQTLESAVAASDAPGIGGIVAQKTLIGRTDSAVTSRGYRGFIDEVMVFDRALSASDVVGLRSTQSGPHFE